MEVGRYREFFRESLKIESVVSEVRSVCFCLSVFSKTIAIQIGDKQTQTLMNISGGHLSQKSNFHLFH